MKTTPADKWFSLCVRERSNWTCEKCGKRYNRDSETRRGLNCAHFQTRDTWSTRLEPLNAFALCTGCHMYYDEEHRFEFDQLYEKVFGDQGRLWELWRDHSGRGKIYKQTKGLGEVAQHYKSEFERMTALREGGYNGRIEFISWLEPKTTEEAQVAAYGG